MIENNCEADPLSPMQEDKEDKLGKYRASFRLLRRLCIVECIWFILMAVVPIVADINPFSVSFWQINMDRMPIMLLAFVGITCVLVVELLTYNSMKRYEEGFHRVMKARKAMVAVPVIMGSNLLGSIGGAMWVLLGSFLGSVYIIMLLLVIALWIVSVYYNYSYCWALSDYIRELSSKQSERLDRWGVILPVLTVITMVPRLIGLYNSMLPLMVLHAVMMSIIPILLGWTCWICSSELKKAGYCGVEVPEGRTACPNTAENLLNPQKEEEKKSPVNYQAAIKPFFRFCVIEWMFMLMSLAVTIYALCSGDWFNFSIEVSLLTDKYIPVLLVSVITVGLMVAARWTYKEMQCFEESFDQAFTYKGGMLVVYYLTFIGYSYVICTVLAVVAAFYYYYFFRALSAYIKDLSPKMSRFLDGAGGYIS
ncbi:MAG: hypothetical protein IKS10_01765 [Lachnospiraceae bacterium]|nr:hypothetical protein [Lachnospiraceae bacterium]